MVRTLVLMITALTCEAQPLRLAIAGLEHGHVAGFLDRGVRHADVRIVGYYDPDSTLLAKYTRQYRLAGDVLFTDLDRMLDTVKPEAVAIFTSTFGHAAVVEACARRRIPVMMEKPLAVSVAQGRAIQQAAARGGIPVIVNYETTWYRSHAELWKLMHDQKAAGEIRKMVAMDGHEGPKEINVQPEFLRWLTDPEKNGAGALFDFGCYGANLMTWLMDNRRPLKVTALAQTNKPSIYARVDDEATILLQYRRAQGIIQASWNWPFSRKDLEVYGERGYAIATGGASLKVKLPGQSAEETRVLPDLPPEQQDSVSYLVAVARGRIKPAGLSSLENNLIVTEILEAARESARRGVTIELGR